MSDGYFYNGADKDIVDQVRAVLNYQNPEISSAGYRIDTGNNDINMVATLRILNDENTVNKNMMIYNGTGYMGVQINPWDEKIVLKNFTNGKQFAPNY